MTLRRVLALGLALATILLGACGSSGSSAPPRPATTTTVRSMTLGPGVSATAVKVGVMMIDFDCVKKYIDEVRLEQRKMYQLYIDYINSHGGVAGGRKIVPVYKTYCPLNNIGELSNCTSLTEDEHVFAAIGILYDPSGDSQLCFAKKHRTPVITNGLTQDLVNRSPEGLLVTPDITPDRRLHVILSLLKSQHTLDGKKVAVLAESTAKPRVRDVIVPALAAMGVERGTDASLNIDGDDTAAAQSQLSSFIEHWKPERVQALILTGEAVSSKQFVEKIKQALPDVLLVADTASVLSSAQDEQKARVRPNPYDGVVTAEGQTGVQHTQSPHGKYCHGIYKEMTGKTVPSPLTVIKTADGKEDDVYGEIEDGCLYPMMFKTIADRVGQHLNADNWATAVNSFGPIADMSTIFASIHRGKYDADDTYGLVSYNPTIGDAGDWNQLSSVQNVAGG